MTALVSSRNLLVISRVRRRSRHRQSERTYALLRSSTLIVTGLELDHLSRLALDDDMDCPVARPMVDKRMKMFRLWASEKGGFGGNLGTRQTSTWQIARLSIRSMDAIGWIRR